MSNYLKKEKFRLIGVDCAACIYSIRRSLEKLGGIVKFEADVGSGEAVVVYDSRQVSTKDIAKAVRDSGYDIEKRQLQVFIDLEEAEASSFEKYVSRLSGVVECRYSPVTKVAVILFNPYTVSESEVLSEVKSKFPQLREASEEVVELIEERESGGYAGRLVSFLAGLSAVAYHSLLAFGVVLPLHEYSPYMLFVLATVVIALNLDIVLRGLRSLSRGVPTMDSLISLSSLVTYIYSTAVLAFAPKHGEVFFEASAGVLGFVAAGKYLEERLRRRASRAIMRLAELAVRTARVVNTDGSTREVGIDSVKVGDTVEVKAGERVPVDGVVVDGQGYVDESMFTGEPTPKLKTSETRDSVLAGSLLVSGYIRVRATRVGEDTSLSYIIRAVREAQFFKPNIQRLADRVVGYLTWAVLFLSAATFCYWFLVEGLGVGEALLFAVSVLAVTCPCPLGIAIPMVISLASIKAAQLGLLVRRSDVLERLLRVNVAILDKTGTLTVGKPKVLGVTPLNSFDPRIALEYACSAELKSEHPLGQAILDYCTHYGISPKYASDYIHIPGLGVIARVGDSEVAVGSYRLIEKMNSSGTDNIAPVIEKVSSMGRTAVVVAIDKTPVAVLEIGDELRPEGKYLVRFLVESGVKPILATGDSAKTASVIASELGIDSIYAELRPEDKVELVESIQSSGARVMFIGDGVNDAAAIGRAFVGVAMGRGSDISKEAGDVVVMSNDLFSIVELFKLAKMSKRKSMENLFWAFAYNLLLVPMAMGFFYKSFGLMLRPEAAAIAMIMSDISVILNSLTLLRWRPK
ncbi:MAG: heavy metal translocating P-type ATPase [Sulfolobales archaeon]